MSEHKLFYKWKNFEMVQIFHVGLYNLCPEMWFLKKTGLDDLLCPTYLTQTKFFCTISLTFIRHLLNSHGVPGPEDKR